MTARYFFVRCKNNQNHNMQFWIPHMSPIYSECTCGQKTSYSAVEGLFVPPWEHYDKFQVDVPGKPFLNDSEERALAEVEFHPEKYQVNEFIPLEVKTRKNLKLK